MFDQEANRSSPLDAADAPVHVDPTNRAIVELNPDHPGFRDPEYRARRNDIAQIAVDYRPGSPIPEASYTEQEHTVWRAVREALKRAHPRHACRAYLDTLERVDLPWDRLPQLSEVTGRIEALSGFRLEPVAGLVRPRIFLSVLANQVFLATQYIRHHSTPLYTPEPDIVHEVIGHGCQLANPIFAELNRAVGAAVERTETEAGIEFISRIYWFTLEFGVLREDGALKAYGAGLLSSAGELEAMHRAELAPMDFMRIGRQEYDVTQYQPLLFCAASIDALQDQLLGFMERWSDDVALGAAPR